MLASNIFAPLNGRNYTKKIDEYNKLTQYDHSKADTLVNTFDKFLDGEDSNLVKVGAVKEDSLMSSRWRGESLSDEVYGDISVK